MAKENKKTVDSDKKKKTKHSNAKDETVSAAPTGFSLFAGAADGELEDVFSKGANFSVPPNTAVVTNATSSNEAVQPRASSFGTQPYPAEASSAVKKPRKEKKRKEKDAHPEISAAVEPIVSPVASTSASPVVQSEPVPKREKKRKAEIPAESSDSESDGSAGSDLLHESLKPAKANRDRGKASKYVPPNESAVDRDRRTVFVGNLPIEVAKSKSALNQLRAHLLTFAPTAKIESVRFRSVPFAAPTSAPTAEDGDEEGIKRAKREKERAATWRAQQDILDGGDERAKEEVDKAQSFIDSKGKRKVAFIKKEFHSELGSCNGYVVFAYPHPDRPANVAPILDPFETATQVLKANGSTFLETTIRFDTVRLPASVGLLSATNALSKKDAWLPGGTDPKRSLFVGGLDYGAKEEDVRVFFEELVKAERGEKAEGRYITGVRIVRDKETQLGKGFGYVHFADRESVDEVIAIDSKKLRFAKKYLRVQQSKTLPPSSKTVKPVSTSSEKPSKPKQPRPTVMPKGDPKLGEKLKDLSKEERKVVKSGDADRQARRMAKKKMRHEHGKVEEKGAVKLGLSRGERDKKGKNVGKVKKGKTRSAAAVAKMKGSRE